MRADPKGAQSPVPTQLPPQRIRIRIRIRPGEVVRFRMLDGNSDNLMPIVVDGHQMHLIALDGVNFAEIRAIPVNVDGDGDGQVLLAPVNQSEFLIRGSSTPGIYRIRQLAQAEQFLLGAEKTICDIEVTGTPVVMKLPPSCRCRHATIP